MFIKYIAFYTLFLLFILSISSTFFLYLYNASVLVQYMLTGEWFKCKIYMYKVTISTYLVCDVVMKLCDGGIISLWLLCDILYFTECGK